MEYVNLQKHCILAGTFAPFGFKKYPKNSNIGKRLKKSKLGIVGVKKKTKLNKTEECRCVF